MPAEPAARNMSSVPACSRARPRSRPSCNRCTTATHEPMPYKRTTTQRR